MRYQLDRCVFAVVLGLGLASGAASSANAESSGDWGSGSGQGFTEYITRAGSSYVAIGCDEAATLDNRGTGISLEIDGKLLPQGSKIRFLVDDHRIVFEANKSGGVSTDCPGCAEKFRTLWDLLRRGSKLVVAGKGGRAQFSLRGTSRLMPEEPCPTKIVDAAAPEADKRPAAAPPTVRALAEDRAPPSEAPAPSKPTAVALSSEETCGRLAPDSGVLTGLGVDPDVASGNARVALVVGMGAYGNGIPELRNPMNDITAVTNALLSIGFTVYYVANADGDAVLRCAEQARDASPDPDVTMLYYAGHGIQIDDANYLVGIDADASGGRKGFVPIDAITDMLRGGAAALVFLDACRDNPFVADGAAGLSPSTGRGLTLVATGTEDETQAKVQARGAFVAYSTSPNAVAQDGDGQFSPFAGAIAAHIVEPGFSIQRVMSAVTETVGEATDWTQTPWTRSSLTGELRLAGPMTAEEAAGASENWARRSRELLEKGHRLEAIAAALKGIPEGVGDVAARAGYPIAFKALENAYLSGNGIVGEELADLHIRLRHGLWSSADRARYTSAFYSGNSDEYIVSFNLYRAADGAKLATLIDSHRTPNYLTTVAISDDSRLIAAVLDNRLTVWEAGSGSEVSSFDARPLLNPTGKSARNIDGFRFNPVGSRLMAKTMFGDDIAVIDTKNGALQAFNLASLTRESPELAQFVTGHNQSTVQANFMGDDAICIVTSGESANQAGLPVAVGTYDVVEGKYSYSGAFEADGAWILQGIHCSPDGRWMAVAAADESSPSHLWIWDTEAGALLAHVETTSEKGRAVFDPTSRYLAIQMESDAAIYDLQERELVVSGLGDRSAVYPTFFDRQGEVKGGGEPGPAFVWALLPMGTSVIAAAVEAVGADLIATVAVERIELWQVN